MKLSESIGASGELDDMERENDNKLKKRVAKRTNINNPPNAQLYTIFRQHRIISIKMSMHHPILFLSQLGLS